MAGESAIFVCLRQVQVESRLQVYKSCHCDHAKGSHFTELLHHRNLWNCSCHQSMVYALDCSNSQRQNLIWHKKDSCLDKKNLNKKDLKKFSTCYGTCNSLVLNKKDCCLEQNELAQKGLEQKELVLNKKDSGFWNFGSASTFQSLHTKKQTFSKQMVLNTGRFQAQNLLQIALCFWSSETAPLHSKVQVFRVSWKINVFFKIHKGSVAVS